MNLISLAIRRPTAVAMFFLVVLATGLVSLSRLPLDLTPDVSFPKLSVVTSWPDSSPETVEAFVTSPIEAAASTIANVKKVDSISPSKKSLSIIPKWLWADSDQQAHFCDFSDPIGGAGGLQLVSGKII